MHTENEHTIREGVAQNLATIRLANLDLEQTGRHRRLFLLIPACQNLWRRGARDSPEVTTAAKRRGRVSGAFAQERREAKRGEADCTEAQTRRGASRRWRHQASFTEVAVRRHTSRSIPKSYHDGPRISTTESSGTCSLLLAVPQISPSELVALAPPERALPRHTLGGREKNDDDSRRKFGATRLRTSGPCS